MRVNYAVCVRIIAGVYRSRRLQAPAGQATRPTSDRLRETLFNVLAPRIVNVPGGAAFLDLYAGSGAVGLEALSRGAARVAFVERESRALAVLRGNLNALGIRGGFHVEARSVAAFLRSAAEAAPKPRGYDIVFLDPPWDAETEYETAITLLGGAAQGLLAQGAVVVAEHRRKIELAALYGSLERTRLLEQGDAALSFYQVADSISSIDISTLETKK